jgi:hypothetical protein
LISSDVGVNGVRRIFDEIIAELNLEMLWTCSINSKKPPNTCAILWPNKNIPDDYDLLALSRRTVEYQVCNAAVRLFTAA